MSETTWFVKKGKIVAGLAGLSLALWASVAYPARAEYRIRDAVADARLANQKLKVLESELAGAKLSKNKAMAEFWPVVTFDVKDQSGSAYSEPKRDSISDGGTQSNLVVEQSLFSGGGSVAKMKAAQQHIIGSEAKFDSDVADVLLSVIDSYQSVLTYRSLYKIALENEKTVRGKLHKVKIRFESGECSRIDVSAAEYALAEAMTSKEGTYGGMKNAEATFFRVVGRMPGEDLVAVNVESFNVLADLESFLAVVRKESRSLIRAKSALSKSRNEVAVAVAGLMPTVSARFELGRAKMDRFVRGDNLNPLGRRTSKTYLLNVRVPIFNVSSYTAVSEAKHQERRSGFALEEVTREGDEEAVKVWNEYKTVVAQVSSQEQSVHAAKDAFEGAQQEYQAGAQDLLNLLEFERRLFIAQVELEKARRSRVLTFFKMKALAGELHKLDFSAF